MRLFIAINFDEDLKDSLCGIINDLKANSVRGNFTRRENLHLTLEFLGELNSANMVTSAMDNVNTAPFPLYLGGFGKFRSGGSNIYWSGVFLSQELINLHDILCSELRKNGFKTENRQYRPHITLGREVELLPGFNENEFREKIPNMQMQANKISLMKSERINGRLNYTEIYKKILIQP